ncbi:MAG: hypothetical protein JOY51_07330, partial [Nevskia sp.]|nr:hypothetical protein [Nevskia sp.]
MRRHFYAAALAALVVGACGGQKHNQAQREPYSSTYVAPAAEAVLIQHATVLTGSGTRIDDGDVLVQDHKIAQVGKNIAAPAGATVVDAQNRWV